MYTTQIEGGNVIYHAIPFESLRNKIHFHSATACTVFIAPDAHMQACEIHLHGNNAAVFIGNSLMGRMQIYVYEQSCVYIGNKVYINEYINEHIRCSGRANVVLGDSCALSVLVEISTTDVHLIYDRTSRKRINEEQSIFIGDHVWLGKEVKVYKRTCISSGCICASRSIVTKGIYPSNSLISGVPGQVKKTGDIFWLSPSSYHFTRADIERYSYLDENDELYLKATFSSNEEEMLSPFDIDATLKSLTSSRDKIAFLYDFLYLNVKQNRFAWDQLEATSVGKVLACGDSFSQLVEETKK